jgi:hypothetical protein
MSSRDIRAEVAWVVNAFKAETGQLPICLQVSRDHLNLNEPEYATYELPNGHAIPIEYVDGMAVGKVRCIGPEALNDLPDWLKA